MLTQELIFQQQNDVNMFHPTAIATPTPSDVSCSTDSTSRNISSRNSKIENLTIENVCSSFFSRVMPAEQEDMQELRKRKLALEIEEKELELQERRFNLQEKQRRLEIDERKIHLQDKEFEERRYFYKSLHTAHKSSSDSL